MKFILSLVIGLFLSSGILIAADDVPQSPEALVKAYEKAINAGDEKQVLKSWELDQANPETAKMETAFAQNEISEKKGGVFSLGSFDNEEDGQPFVMDGKKVEWLLSPEGSLVVKLKEYDSTTMMPYARTAKGYKLIGQRWTKLNWSGPPDSFLSFSVSSQSPAKPDGPLILVVRFSASGIMMEKRIMLKNGSQTKFVGIVGQRVEEIEALENKGPARGFSLKRDNNKEIVFEGTIPAETVGIIYRASDKIAPTPATASK